MLKPLPRSVTKRAQKRAKEQADRDARRDVLIRDHYRCRCCGSTYHIDAHHLKFRSAGGATSDRNMACLCRCCHDLIHAYRLAVVGENANKELRFVRRDAL
jgi:5-methylcytosine-specific restriction endonuclease McrA